MARGDGVGWSRVAWEDFAEESEGAWGRFCGNGEAINGGSIERGLIGISEGGSGEGGVGRVSEVEGTGGQWCDGLIEDGPGLVDGDHGRWPDFQMGRSSLSRSMKAVAKAKASAR